MGRLDVGTGVGTGGMWGHGEVIVSCGGGGGLGSLSMACEPHAQHHVTPRAQHHVQRRYSVRDAPCPAPRAASAGTSAEAERSLSGVRLESTGFLIRHSDRSFSPSGLC